MVPTTFLLSLWFDTENADRQVQSVGSSCNKAVSPHNRRADVAMQYTLFPEPDRSSTVPVLAWFMP